MGVEIYYEFHNLDDWTAVFRQNRYC